MLRTSIQVALVVLLFSNLIAWMAYGRLPNLSQTILGVSAFALAMLVQWAFGRRALEDKTNGQ